jgi:hypothetical protein
MVEADEKVDRANVARAGVDDEVGEFARGRLPLQVGRELAGERGLVADGLPFGLGLDEEVERVDGGHLGDEIDREANFLARLREDEAREVVAVGVLLPIQEMRLRLDLERITQDRRAAVRGRAEADDVRLNRHEPVVAVLRDVVQGNSDGHGKGSGIKRARGRSQNYRLVKLRGVGGIGCGE